MKMICDHAEQCLVGGPCEHREPHDATATCEEVQPCYWPQAETEYVKCLPITEKP